MADRELTPEEINAFYVASLPMTQEVVQNDDGTYTHTFKPPQWGWDPPRESYQRIPLRELRHQDSPAGKEERRAEFEKQMARFRQPTLEAVGNFFASIEGVVDALRKAFKAFNDPIWRTLAPPISHQQKLRRHNRGPHWKRTRVLTSRQP